MTDHVPARRTTSDVSSHASPPPYAAGGGDAQPSRGADHLTVNCSSVSIETLNATSVTFNVAAAVSQTNVDIDYREEETCQRWSYPEQFVGWGAPSFNYQPTFWQKYGHILGNVLAGIVGIPLFAIIVAIIVVGTVTVFGWMGDAVREASRPAAARESDESPFVRHLRAQYQPEPSSENP
ncbi:MAG: hypothetical protein ACYCS7_03935 [Acidimicrobiales bacterium]